MSWGQVTSGLPQRPRCLSCNGFSRSAHSRYLPVLGLGQPGGDFPARDALVTAIVPIQLRGVGGPRTSERRVGTHDLRKGPVR